MDLHFKLGDVGFCPLIGGILGLLQGPEGLGGQWGGTQRATVRLDSNDGTRRWEVSTRRMSGSCHWNSLL